MTSHRTKHPTPAGEAARGLLGALGRPGQDRRGAAEYAADLAGETEASPRRDPKRWRTRRTNEVPKDRGTSRGVRRDKPGGAQRRALERARTAQEPRTATPGWSW
jgi:hypothetical protein